MDPEQFSTLEQPRFEFAMEVRLRFTRVQQITQLPTGGVRSAVYVDSGEFSGPNIKGKAVPNSGGDYALFRPDDVAIFDARYMLQEDDGTLILLHNKGFLWGRTPDVMDRLRKWAFEGGAPVEMVEIIRNAAFEIVGMNAFGPAVAELLFERPAREGQPCFVEIVTLGVEAGTPDHDRRMLHQQSILSGGKGRRRLHHGVGPAGRGHTRSVHDRGGSHKPSLNVRRGRP